MDKNNKIKLFLENLIVEKNISYNTFKSYEKDLKDFELFFSKRCVKNITYENINTYIANLKESYYSSSVKRKIATLNGYFKFLCNENYIELNPMTKLETFKSKRSLPDYLNKEEMQRLLCFASKKKDFIGRRDYALIELFYATGMRVSEVVSLKMQDVLPLFSGKSYITIRGKGGRERVVLFTKNALTSLESYVSFLKSEDCKWLFLRKNDVNSSSITRQGVGKIFKRIALGAGVEEKKVSPHVIRHSFATHLLCAGMKIKIIKELLGHKSISTTQIYTHLADDKLKEMLEINHPLAGKNL